MSWMVWLVMLPIAAFVGFILIARIFRRIRTRSEVPIGADFGIDELHELMSRGKLSAEEFERARNSVLARRPQTEMAAGKTPARAFEVQPMGESATRSPQTKND